MRVLLAGVVLLTAAPVAASSDERAALSSIAVQSVEVAWVAEKKPEPPGLIGAIHEGLADDLVGSTMGTTPVAMSVRVTHFQKGLVGERTILADVDVTRVADSRILAQYKRVQVGAARGLGSFIKKVGGEEAGDPSTALGGYLAQAIRKRLPSQKSRF